MERNNSDQKGGECVAPTNGIQEQVKEYYGRILSTKNDLKTSACCSIE